MIAETSRLILRELHPDDAEALHPVFSDPEATRFALRIHATVADTEGWINAVRNGYTKHGFGPWCMVRKSDLSTIGYCGCGIVDVEDQREYEIGYRVLPSCWGQGFATEATRAAIAHAFNDLSLLRLVAVIQPTNVASVRVAEKAGMQYIRDTTFRGVPVRLYVIEKGGSEQGAGP